MNVKKKTLLDAAQTAIDNYEAKRGQYDWAAAEWVKRNNLAANTNALDVQRKLRDALSAAIKAKTPLSEQQLKVLHPKGDAWGYTSSFAPKVVDKAPREFKLDGLVYRPAAAINRADLDALIALLNAVEEDTISDSQLSRLGFKHVGWIIRDAVANGGEVK